MATETGTPDTAVHADLIVMNGRIATQDERRSFASAVAITEGRFLAVGTDKEVSAHKGDTTQVIDVGGRTVIPGLNDSHLHLIFFSHIAFNKYYTITIIIINIVISIFDIQIVDTIVVSI